MFSIFRKRKSKDKPITVDALLKRDDVTEVLSILDKTKPDIKTLIAIYIKEDDTIGWTTTDDVTHSDLIYYLESVKYEIFQAEDRMNEED